MTLYFFLKLGRRRWRCVLFGDGPQWSGSCVRHALWPRGTSHFSWAAAVQENEIRRPGHQPVRFVAAALARWQWEVCPQIMSRASPEAWRWFELRCVVGAPRWPCTKMVPVRRWYAFVLHRFQGKFFFSEIWENVYRIYLMIFTTMIDSFAIRSHWTTSSKRDIHILT